MRYGGWEGGEEIRRQTGADGAVRKGNERVTEKKEIKGKGRMGVEQVKMGDRMRVERETHTRLHKKDTQNKK